MAPFQAESTILFWDPNLCINIDTSVGEVVCVSVCEAFERGQKSLQHTIGLLHRQTLLNFAHNDEGATPHDVV